MIRWFCSLALSTLVASPALAGADALKLPDRLSFDLVGQVSLSGTQAALVSPAGLMAGFGMARAGLAEDERTHEADRLGIPLAADPETGFLTASAVWVDQAYTLVPEAGDALAARWQAPVSSVEMAVDGASAINAWVDGETDGAIPSLVPEGLDAAIVLANVFLFKDVWADPFDPLLTAPRAFTLPDGTTAEVPMMTGEKLHPCWEVSGSIVVTLGLQHGGRRVVIVLPPEGAGYPDAEGLAGQPLDPGQARLVQLVLPTLALGDDRDLGPELAGLGLAEPLGEGLTRITTPSPAMGPVFQSVRLKLDETGAEAAAATAVVGSRSLDKKGPPLVVIDRPFLVFLVDPTIPTPLVAGMVTDPRNDPQE